MASDCANSKSLWLSCALGPSLCNGRKFPQIVLTFGCRFLRILKTKTLLDMYLLWHKFCLGKASGCLVFLHLLSGTYHWTKIKEKLKALSAAGCFWSSRLEFVGVLWQLLWSTCHDSKSMLCLLVTLTLDAATNSLCLVIQSPYAVFLCWYWIYGLWT